MPTAIEKKVAKGAAFLDKKVPDWAGTIKVKKIVMESNDDCILGQLGKAAKAGDAYAYARSLGLKETQLVSYGFEYDGDEDGQVAAWKAEIEKRLGPKTAPKKTASQPKPKTIKSDASKHKPKAKK